MHKQLISLIVLTPLLAGVLEAQVIPKTTTPLESYDMPSYFLVCRNTTQSVQLVQGGNETPQGLWNIVTGLTGSGTVSFMPAALPNHYMRHRSYILYADPAATDALYMGDASLTPRPGLANPDDPSLVSFESQNYPGRFLIHGAPGTTIGFRIDPVTTADERARATFRFPDLHAELATKPIPADKATDVPRDVILQWTPGQYAGTHDVYFGTLFDDVNSANRAAPQGVLASQGQTTTTLDPAGFLAWGQSYFWRIDEVNATADQTVFKGKTWSFTVETYGYRITTPIKATASSSTNALTGPEKTIDGSGLNSLDQHSTSSSQMWLSKKNVTPIWIQYEFDTLYRLHQMWVWNQNQLSEPDDGLGAREVTIETSTDGTTWTTLSGVPEFAQGPGEETYVHNTTVDFHGALAKFVRLNILNNWGDVKNSGLAEVRFYYVPVKAYGPTPASGATSVAVDAVLNWRPGRLAASHEVYLGTAPNTLSKAGTVSDHRYDLSSAGVEYDRTYYWKVNEVNAAEVWEGDVWSFSTPGTVVVEDFESYDDKCKRIFYTWADGYGVSAPECGGSPVPGNGSGSTVGNTSAPYAERTNVHSGTQAIPFFYDNTSGSGVSETARTFSPAQDWTVSGIKTLVLFFKGGFANGAGQVYVKINGIKVPFGGNADALKTDLWTQWNVDLSSLSVKAVSTLTIGVSGTGKGVMYVDDIRLYRSAPAEATEQLSIEAESATPSVPAPWTLSDDVLASGGKYVTTPSTATASTAAPTTTGVLTYNFTVKGGVYRLWFRTGPILGGGNDSFWVRIKDATIDPAGSPTSPGWVRANNLSGQAGMSTWHWVVVWDNDNGDRPTQFTLSAGSHTLEVGYRELAVPLDAILITDN